MKLLSLFILPCFASSAINAQIEDEPQSNTVFEMTLEELLNIEVTTAGKRPEKIERIPASVVVMHRQEIHQHGFISLEEVLETVPGLYAINDFAFNDVVFGVRGFWSSSAKQILILINGVRQIEAYASSYVVKNIGVPVEAIDRIEVVRGPSSVLYGSGAFFATINIITNSSMGDPTSLVSLGYGSQNMKKVFLRKEEKSEHLSYALNASWFSSEGMDVPYERFTDESISGVPDTTRGQLENEEKYFNFAGSAAGWSVDFTLLENPREQFFFGPSKGDGYINRVGRGAFSIGYNEKVSDKVSYSGRFNYINQTSQTRGDYPLGFSSVGDFYGQENIDTEFIELEANAFLNPSDKLDITLGANFYSITHVLDQANLPTFGVPFIPTSLGDGESIDTTALFSQVSYLYANNITVVAGVRLEQQSSFDVLSESYNAIDNDISVGSLVRDKRSFQSSGVEVMPRISLLYTTKYHHTIKFLYGESIIRPSFSQLQFSLEERPTLIPESIKTYEINYLAPIGRNTSTNLSVFSNQLQDLIVRTDERLPSGGFTNYNSNAGKQVTNGAELSINTRFFNSNLLFDFSATYQKSEDKRVAFENIDVAYSPQLLVQFKARYYFKEYVLALSGNFVDEMDTLFIGIPNDGGNREGPVTDSHWVLNANLLSENLFGTELYVNLRVSNILNEKYSYPAASFNGWAEKGLPGDERLVMFVVGKEF